MRILGIAVAAMLLLTARSWADAVSDEKGVKELVVNIMAKVEKADLLGAFATIKPYMPVTNEEFDQIALKYKAVIEEYFKKYGNPTDVEFIDMNKIGNSLLRIRYIEKNEKYAHTWSFYFHKTKEGWIIDSFNWDDSIRKLFES